MKRGEEIEDHAFSPKSEPLTFFFFYFIHPERYRGSSAFIAPGSTESAFQRKALKISSVRLTRAFLDCSVGGRSPFVYFGNVLRTRTRVGRPASWLLQAIVPLGRVQGSRYGCFDLVQPPETMLCWSPRRKHQHEGICARSPAFPVFCPPRQTGDKRATSLWKVPRTPWCSSRRHGLRETANLD